MYPKFWIQEIFSKKILHGTHGNFSKQFFFRVLDHFKTFEKQKNFFAKKKRVVKKTCIHIKTFFKGTPEPRIICDNCYQNVGGFQKKIEKVLEKNNFFWGSTV